jgi:hypothetical protein
LQLSYLSVDDALLAPAAVCLQLLHLSMLFGSVGSAGEGQMLFCSDCRSAI